MQATISSRFRKAPKLANDSARLTVDPVAAEKRIVELTLRAGLLWNNGPLVDVWVTDKGIFCHHNSMSAGEHFFEFLLSVGVVVPEQGVYRLAVRLDALQGYASFLVDSGLHISRTIDALVCLGGEGWLKTTRDPFEPTYYGDDTDAFDTRQLMADLACLGYAEKVGNSYRWSGLMEPHLKAHHY